MSSAPVEVRREVARREGAAVRVRAARSGEGSLVAEWIRASLPPAVVEMTIWASSRVDRYVEEHLAAGPDSAETGYYLLEIDGAEPAGIAEFRVVDGTGFLNQIYVAPEHRGRLLGRLLLHDAAGDWTARKRASAVMLDVEVENRRTYRWYEQLGFQPLMDVFWQVGPIRSPTVAPGKIAGETEAEQRQRRWGFSRFSVQTPDGCYPGGCYGVGRLPAGFFRLDSVDAWRDDALHAALHRLDPARRILLLTPAAQSDLETVRHSRRMSVDAALMMGRLAPSRSRARKVRNGAPNASEGSIARR